MLKRHTPLRSKKPWRPKPPEKRGCSLEVEQGPSKPYARVRPPAAPPPKPIRRGRPKKKGTAARKEARGQPCLIRLPGCSPGPENETVVLCHFRLANTCGMGLKPDDALGSLGCTHCHDIVDGRAPLPYGYTLSEVRLAFAEGVMRTWLYMKDLHRV